LAYDAISTPNAQALANDDATNPFNPKNVGSTPCFSPARSRIFGLQRSFDLERASVGLGRLFQSARAKSVASNDVSNPFAKALACEARFTPLIRKRRCSKMKWNALRIPTAKLLERKVMLPHTIDAGGESLSKRKRTTNFFAV